MAQQSRQICFISQVIVHLAENTAPVLLGKATENAAGENSKSSCVSVPQV